MPPAEIYERVESALLSTTHEEPLLRPVMPELDTIRGVAVLMVFDAYDAVVSRYVPRLDATPGHLNVLWIRFLISSAAAIFVAWVSRETFEEFFLSRKENWSVAKIPAVAQLQ
jgi:hypothetical protein